MINTSRIGKTFKHSLTFAALLGTACASTPKQAQAQAAPPANVNAAATSQEAASQGCVAPPADAPRQPANGEVALGDACVMTVPKQETNQKAPEAPPANAVTEQKPASPAPNYVWASGYWYWAGTRYVWVPGYWVAPRPGYVYVTGRWTLVNGVWIYRPGGWAVAGTAVVVVRPVRPVAVVWVRPMPRVIITPGIRVTVVRRPIVVRPTVRVVRPVPRRRVVPARRVPRRRGRRF